MTKDQTEGLSVLELILCTAADEGWGEDTAIRVLADFIEEQQKGKELAAYLENRCSNL